MPFPTRRNTLLRRSDSAFVFQSSQLVLDFTALGNVAVPLQLGGTKPPDTSHTG